jgi:hypothetical protein
MNDKEKIIKIQDEVNEALAFEEFLLRKDRKPDEFNQGRFYIAQIIKDILNGEKEPDGKHKENKDIIEINYIPKSVIKTEIRILESNKEKALDTVKRYERYIQATVGQDTFERKSCLRSKTIELAEYECYKGFIKDLEEMLKGDN